MELRDIHWKIIKKIPKKLGTIFFINGEFYRRGKGILYSGLHGGKDPFLNRNFWRRKVRRDKGMF